MSSLSEQVSSFRSQLSSHTAISTPLSTSTAEQPPAKKAKPNTSKIYSQPNDTGTGRHWQTKVVYLVSFLKENGPTRLDDLAIKLSMDQLLNPTSELFEAFMRHEKVVRDERTELFSYKPDYHLKSSSDLHTLLAAHHSRGGMPVKLLRESWPLVGNAVEELEREGKVMVIRTGGRSGAGDGRGNGVEGKDGEKKEEGILKTVFFDPLGRISGVDSEFRDMWTQLATPSPDDLAEELKTAGLTAASTIAVATTLAKKKKGGKGMGSHNRKLKITNTHLKDLGIDLSKDFVKGK